MSRTSIVLSHSSDILTLDARFEGNLASCKAFMERFEAFVRTSDSSEPPHWSRMTEAERVAAQRSNELGPDGYHTGGGKIPAIKMVRERLGLGLRDAKDLVDSYLDGVSRGLTA